MAASPESTRRPDAAAGAAGGAAAGWGVWLRSLAFFVLYNALGIAHSLLSLLLAPLLSFPARYRFVNLWTRGTMWLLRHLNGVEIVVEGREHLPLAPSSARPSDSPPGRPLVVMANHQSQWETFYLQLLISPQTTVVKRSLLWVPFFGWALALLRPIAIDRGRGAQALKDVVRIGAQRLGAGVSVVIYPEGTRQPPGVLGPFNAGGAMLASRAGCALLPIVHNSGDCWPARSLLRRPGTIRVRIGAPIDTAGKSPKALTAEVRAWMQSHYPGQLTEGGAPPAGG